MKRSLAIFAITALLAVSLAACGANRNGNAGKNTNGTKATDNATNGNENGTGPTDNVTGAVNRSTRYGTANGATNGTNGMTNGATNGYGGNASSGAYTGNNAVNNGTGNNTYAARNNGGVVSGTTPAASGDRYALMLENARVHDTDGYLLDGENAHYSTF